MFDVVRRVDVCLPGLRLHHLAGVRLGAEVRQRIKYFPVTEIELYSLIYRKTKPWEDKWEPENGRSSSVAIQELNCSVK